jgi:hypothetical protein
MPYIIIIEKNGTVKEMNIKEYRETELFKKAGFKSSDGFLLQTKWNIVVEQKKHTLSVYGKTNGKAGQENKYDFPPPIDTVLFFGGCVLTNFGADSTIHDLRIRDWNMIYDKLMGGFDDLDENEEEEEEEEEDIPAGMKLSKDGYVCDDFIVDDDEDIDYDNLSVEEDEAEDEAEEEEVMVKEVKPKIAKPVKIVKPAKKPTIKPIETENVLFDYQSELSEEEYL